jgi:hypothetical protein
LAEKPPEQDREELDLSPEARRRAEALTTKVIKAHFAAEEADKEQAAYAEDQARLGTPGYGKPGQQRLDEVGAYARVDPDVERERALLFGGLSTAAGIPNVDERTARRLVNPTGAIADAAVPIPFLNRFFADEAASGAARIASRADTPARRAARKALSEEVEETAEETTKASTGVLRRQDPMSPTGFSFPREGHREYMTPHRLEVLLDTNVKTGELLTHFIEQFASDPSHRLLAKKIRPFLGEVEVSLHKSAHGFSSRPGDSGLYHADRVSGLNTIKVRSRRVTAMGPNRTGHIRAHGTDSETLLHEALHAATVRRLTDGRRLANRGTELHKATADLDYLFTAVKQHARKQLQNADELSPELRILLERSNALNKTDELISWGLTNREFREYLKTIKTIHPDKSVYTEFIEKMMELLGLTTKEERDALITLIEKTDDLLEAPLRELQDRDWTKLVPDVGKGKSSPPAPVTAEELGAWDRWIAANPPPGGAP